ncbi:hypothetical protein HK100_011521 [Physocladia obscura]|uniref:Thioredoxin domain-containing protein n=1 Tax=Physocladia obscura TaxID=109957 RepID=A0AAD5XGX2_9FUNG|nr:hypothetical protein HK100_011521 [Physocladia obscura]
MIEEHNNSQQHDQQQQQHQHDTFDENELDAYVPLFLSQALLPSGNLPSQVSFINKYLNPNSPEPDIEIDEDALFEELEKDDDHLLANMRERRMQELRAEMMKQQEMASNQHGTYENILSEKEVLKITTTTDKVVVHFYHKEFRRCQIMDKHLGTLARKHFKTRFIKIDVEVCPFLVEKLKVQVLPCVIPFIKGISLERLIGFEELGESDSFQTAILERRLIELKVLTPDPRDETGPRKTIFGFSEKSRGNNDDDDEEMSTNRSSINNNNNCQYYDPYRIDSYSKFSSPDQQQKLYSMFKTTAPPAPKTMPNASVAASIAAKQVAKNIKRGIVAHAHISPSFSRVVPLAWNKDLKAEEIELVYQDDDGNEKNNTDAVRENTKKEGGGGCGGGGGNTWGISGLVESPIMDNGSPLLQKSTNSLLKSDAFVHMTRKQSDDLPVQNRQGRKPETLNSKAENTEVWIKDLIVTKKSRKESLDKEYPIRISIHSLETTTARTNHEFPECHRITIKSPLRDSFFHWTFLCHQFNFRTLAKSNGWNVGNSCNNNHGAATAVDEFRQNTAVAIDPLIASFQRFGRVVKDRIRECLRDPESRKRLSKSPFIVVRICSVALMHYSNIYNALVQSLNLISKIQPVLLLTGGVPDPLQPEQVKPWKDLVKDLLGSRPESDSANEQRILTNEEKMLRKKMFVLLTLPNEESIEVVLTKSMFVQIQGYHGNNETKTIRLTFSFLAKSYKKDLPTSYFITITTSDDVFFNFTSQEISRETFYKMTTKIHVNLETETYNKYHTSKHEGRRQDSASFEKRKGERMEMFGFHPNEGAGGVIGVIANDLLKNVENDPERYTVLFKVRNRTATILKSISASGEIADAKKIQNDMDKENRFYKSGLEWKVVDSDTGRTTLTVGAQAPDREHIENTHENLKFRINELHGLTSQNPPDRRKAKLIFRENVLFREREILEIEFVETAREQMQSEVRNRYERLKIEIDWVQYRLDVRQLHSLTQFDEKILL